MPAKGEKSPSQRSKKGSGGSHRPNSPSQSKKKKEGGSPTGSTGSSPTAKAAALLAEALDRSSINATASYDGKTSAYDGKTAASIFDEAFDAAKLGDFEATLRVLADVSKQDALLQALLQAQADTPEGHTLLHQAASHGHVQGVRDLLRRGADAARLNLEGQSSLDVAQEKGHDEVTRMLHVWTDAWSGWDAEEPWVTLPPRYLLRGGRDPGVVNTHSTPNTVKSEKIMRCATLLGK